MLIFMSIAHVVFFILTQIPFHLYAIGGCCIHWMGDVRTPILLWSSVYFGIGFYAYCLTSPYFRNKFISTVYRCLHREDPMIIRRNAISQRFPHWSMASNFLVDCSAIILLLYSVEAWQTECSPSRVLMSLVKYSIMFIPNCENHRTDAHVS
jgi:hypothetical protein